MATIVTDANRHLNGRTLDGTLEIQVRAGGPFVKVDWYIFRSWTGARRRNDATWTGPVYVLGSNVIHRPAGHAA